MFVYIHKSVSQNFINIHWSRANSRSSIGKAVLNLSAPEILQRPAPKQGGLLFGAQRPERPRAPANPAQATQRGSLRELSRGLVAGGRGVVVDGNCSCRWQLPMQLPAASAGKCIPATDGRKTSLETARRRHQRRAVDADAGSVEKILRRAPCAARGRGSAPLPAAQRREAGKSVAAQPSSAKGAAARQGSRVAVPC